MSGGKSRRVLLLLILAWIVSFPLSVYVRGEDVKNWFRRPHDYRLIVLTASHPDSRTAFVEFHSGGRCRSDGRDIIITDDKGKEVGRRIMAIGPGDKFLVAFNMTSSSTYHVYMGSNTVFASPSTWYPRAGLLLKTYRRPDGSSKNAKDFMAMIRKVSILDGAGYRDAVFDGYNPFGPSDNYISVYSGYINITGDGKYIFATNSDDSSILFIDDMPMAEFPGLHEPFAVWGEKNGTIGLKAGIHKLDYFHVEFTGGQATVAGWKKPDDKFFSLVPVTAFVHIAPARVQRVENRKGTIADFKSSFGEIYPVGKESGLVEMKFRQYSIPNEEIAHCKWDFGDGESSVENNPNHIYAVPGTYDVYLLIQDKKKKVYDVTHRIPVYINEGALSHNPEKTRKAFCEALQKYSFSNTSYAGLKNMLAFYSVETDPAKVIFFCRQLLNKIPESKGELSAQYALQMAEQMKDFPRLGDFRKRREIYESILRTTSDGECVARAAYELGDIGLFYAKNYNTAAGWYKKALAISKDFTLRRLAMIRLADTILYSGNPDKAKKAYEEIPPVNEDEKAESILRTAYGQFIESCMREGKYGEALDTLNKWEWEYPEVKLDGYSFLLRIRINYKLNNLNEVSKYAYYILEIIDDESYKPETYHILISLYLRANRKESALHLFEKMKTAFPKNSYTRMLKPAFEPEH